MSLTQGELNNASQEVVSEIQKPGGEKIQAQQNKVPNKTSTGKNITTGKTTGWTTTQDQSLMTRQIM